MAWPIAPKQDDPQRLIALNGVPLKFWLSAEEINEIIKRLSALLGEETSLFKGEFDYMEELEAEHPLPEPGSTAHLRVVNGDDIFCRWDNTDKKWIQDGLVKDQPIVNVDVAENIRAVLEATGTKYYGTKDGVAGVWAFPSGTGGGTDPVATPEGFKVLSFTNGYQGGLTWKPYSSFEFEGNPFTATATLTPTTADIPVGEKKFAALVLNSNGTITLAQGQPAVNPSAPNIDPATQMIPDGGLILLSAGAAAPDGLSLKKIYTNNSGIAGGEADATIFRGGARWNLASNEGDGISIKGTNLLANDRVDFTFENPVPIAEFTELTFKITNLVDTGLPAGNYGGFAFFLRGSVMVRNKLTSSTVLLPTFEKSGYDVTNIGGEQYISIKIPAVSLIDVTQVSFIFDHSDPAVIPTILLDEIKYNDGSAPSGDNFATVGFVERVIAELRAYVDQQDLNLSNRITALEASYGGGTGSGVTKRYLTWAALLADQATQIDLGVYYVSDASGHSTVDSGFAYFEYLGTTNGTEVDYRKLSEQESMDVAPSGGSGTSNIAAGTFSGEFNVSGGNRFYDDYTSGAIVNLSVSATKALGSQARVRIKGDLIGVIPAGWYFSGDPINKSGGFINELTLMYVNEGDVNLVNRAFYIEAAGFEAEYQALLDYGTANSFDLPTATQQEKDNLKVRYLKITGAWYEMDVIRIYNAENYAPTSWAKNIYRLNWKDPSKFALTADAGAEPVWTNGSGFLGGVDKFARTGFRPALDASLMKHNNAAEIFALFNAPTTYSTGYYWFGGRSSVSGDTSILIGQNANAKFLSRVHSGNGEVQLTNQNEINSHFHILRENNQLLAYRNGNTLLPTIISDLKTVMTEFEQYEFAFNTAGTATISAVQIGIKYHLQGAAARVKRLDIYEILNGNFTPAT